MAPPLMPPSPPHFLGPATYGTRSPCMNGEPCCHLCFQHFLVVTYPSLFAPVHALLRCSVHTTTLDAPPDALSLPAAFASHFVLSSFFPQRQSTIYDVLLANHTSGLDTATLNLAQYIGVTRTYKHFANRWVGPSSRAVVRVAVRSGTSCSLLALLLTCMDHEYY